MDVIVLCDEVAKGEQSCTQGQVVPVSFECMFRVLNHEDRLILEYRYADCNIGEATSRGFDCVFNVAVRLCGKEPLKFVFNLSTITGI